MIIELDERTLPIGMMILALKRRKFEYIDNWRGF